MPPELRSPRLLLRPFVAADAADVRRQAGDARVAVAAAAIPHPYPEGAAESWIATHLPLWRARREAHFAIVPSGPGGGGAGRLVGAIALIGIDLHDEGAEIGYWIGVDHWGRGYASEAARRLIGFARDELGLTRIVGRCVGGNPASARVLEKAGLQLEGRLRLHQRVAGGFDDVLLYGVVLPGRGAAGGESASAGGASRPGAAAAGDGSSVSSRNGGRSG